MLKYDWGSLRVSAWVVKLWLLSEESEDCGGLVSAGGCYLEFIWVRSQSWIAWVPWQLHDNLSDNMTDTSAPSNSTVFKLSEEIHLWTGPDIFNDAVLSLDNKYKSGKLAREWSKVKRFQMLLPGNRQLGKTGSRFMDNSVRINLYLL